MPGSEGTPITNSPAARAEATPVGVSSSATASPGSTPRRRQASVYRSGAGFGRSTSSPAITTSKAISAAPRAASTRGRGELDATAVGTGTAAARSTAPGIGVASCRSCSTISTSSSHSASPRPGSPSRFSRTTAATPIDLPTIASFSAGPKLRPYRANSSVSAAVQAVSVSTSSPSQSKTTAAGLLNRLEPVVRPVAAPDLGAGLAVDQHHVGGGVVWPAPQRRADAVGVDWHALSLERAYARRVEPARHDDLHAAMAGVVERLAHAPDQHLVDAGRTE